MEILDTILWLKGNWDTLMIGVMGIITGFSVLAKLTPSKVDDEYIAKAIKFIDFMALNKQRK